MKIIIKTLDYLLIKIISLFYYRLNELSNNKNKMLIVFDNVENEEVIKDYIDDRAPFHLNISNLDLKLLPLNIKSQ